MCYALRHRPGGAKAIPLKDIRLVVRKPNGSRVSIQAISKAAKTYKDF